MICSSLKKKRTWSPHMDKRSLSGHKGQTLVELAVVLPCVCLGIFMGLQLIFFCHNMIELQRMAALDIERVSLEHFRAGGKHFLFDSMFGDISAPRAKFQKEPTTWRPFKGWSTVHVPGQIVSVEEKSILYHGAGYAHDLAQVTQSANAETLLETPLPEDR
jgi:hypothetical protein